VHDAEHGCYLGRAGTTSVFSGARRSTLVLGPTRSGKTSALLVPNVLLARNAVVTTSTKVDVLLATSSRSRVGHVHLFDPSGTTPTPPGVTRVGWSPIGAATEWDAAVHTADAMVDASRLRARGSGADHWTERARALLAPLLHAAALEGRGIADLAAWVDLRDGREPLAHLIRHAPPTHPASASLSGLLATDSRELSGI
jgi:type IV secretion system protein VirD4